MNEYRYVVFGSTRGYGELEPHEVYWNGKVGRTFSRLTTRKVTEAAVFDKPSEAYDVVNALVRVGHLPDGLLDARVGRRMVAE